VRACVRARATVLRDEGTSSDGRGTNGSNIDEKTQETNGKRELIITSHLTTHYLQRSLMTSTFNSSYWRDRGTLYFKAYGISVRIYWIFVIIAQREGVRSNFTWFFKVNYTCRMHANRNIIYMVTLYQSLRNDLPTKGSCDPTPFKIFPRGLFLVCGNTCQRFMLIEWKS